jgi:hypothetical protein
MFTTTKPTKLHFCKQAVQTQLQGFTTNGSNFVPSFRSSLDSYVGIIDGRTLEKHLKVG